MKKNDAEVKKETKEVKAVTKEVNAEVLQAPYIPDVQDEISPEEMENLLKITPECAYWITERSGFTQKSHCSHCGAAAMAIRDSNDETLTPFCPMCGYIMK